MRNTVGRDRPNHYVSQALLIVIYIMFLFINFVRANKHYCIGPIITACKIYMVNYNFDLHNSVNNIVDY